MNFRDLMPPALMELNRTFHDHGFQLYLVGGAVRNLVLGLEPKDWDCATDARPQDVMAMFRRVIPTGVDHGTVSILHRGQTYEVTTFRVDGDYSDGRRPDQVQYTGDIVEDLARRDFTVNAMAVNLDDGELLDPYHGQEDLRRGLIRTVGDPMQRFGEDGLRLARAVRFAAQLGFTIDAPTWEAVGPSLPKLAGVSVERFRDEFMKTLEAPHAHRGVELLHQGRLWGLFIPALGGLQNPQEVALAGQVVSSLPPGHGALRLAALVVALPALPRPDLIGLFDRLRFSKRFLQSYTALVEAIPLAVTLDEDPTNLRRWLRAMAPGTEADTILLYRALDRHGLLGPLPRSKVDWDRIDGLVRDLLVAPPPRSVKDLAIDGNDLVAFRGVRSGKWVGEALDSLLAWVVDHPDDNQRESLLELARTLWDPAGETQPSE